MIPCTTSMDQTKIDETLQNLLILGDNGTDRGVRGTDIAKSNHNSFAS